MRAALGEWRTENVRLMQRENAALSERDALKGVKSLEWATAAFEPVVQLVMRRLAAERARRATAARKNDFGSAFLLHSEAMIIRVAGLKCRKTGFSSHSTKPDSHHRCMAMQPKFICRERGNDWWSVVGFT